MGRLDAIILGYFSLQGILLWAILRSRLPRASRYISVAAAIGAIPAFLFYTGLTRQYADGGGLNNVLIFFALTGGLSLCILISFSRWLTRK
jgi:hypothetical protein